MEKEQQQIHMEISTMDQLADVTACLLEQLRLWQVEEEKQMDIRLCIMEAVQNALLYSCKPDTEIAHVQVSWQCSQRGFSFTVEDDGPGVPIGLRSQDWDHVSLEEHGRGLLLMQAILDEVCFNERGNRVTGRIRW